MFPDTIGCMWTGEFDLNTLRMDGETFESGMKKLRIQKYPDTCAGRVLKESAGRFPWTKNYGVNFRKFSGAKETEFSG